jgi:hypothetical protein
VKISSDSLNITAYDLALLERKARIQTKQMKDLDFGKSVDLNSNLLEQAKLLEFFEKERSKAPLAK